MGLGYNGRRVGYSNDDGGSLMSFLLCLVTDARYSLLPTLV